MALKKAETYTRALDNAQDEQVNAWAALADLGVDGDKFVLPWDAHAQRDQNSASRNHQQADKPEAGQQRQFDPIATPLAKNRDEATSTAPQTLNVQPAKKGSKRRRDHIECKTAPTEPPVSSLRTLRSATGYAKAPPPYE